MRTGYIISPEAIRESVIRGVILKGFKVSPFWLHQKVFGTEYFFINFLWPVQRLRKKKGLTELTLFLGIILFFSEDFPTMYPNNA